MSTDFEKLGVFYLGRKWNYSTKQVTDDLLLYDSSDLVTHAVCIGMTGSGKTGLCLDLVEEAAIDSIPVIAIDVKGDITNLFSPNPAASPEEQKRIELLKASSDLALYTPGSSAGTPVSVLKSFDVPPQVVMEDGDAMRERLESTVTSILTLMGIDADPLQSREHILLTNILRTLWLQGKSVTVFDLVGLIQKPPVTRIGAIEVESIFSSKDRFGFAMKLNNLLASPSFEMWMQGAQLDIDSILHNPSGKPTTSVFYISHLSDDQRMFFVTTLLSRIVSWMREQSGTPSLRAIIYMDEIFGFFPPIANPPSKQPLLTLLKQARAYGVGVLLATQNPVDLDYKGLSNTGTWFIGRLQTERDKARVLDGLEGAAQAVASPFDRQKMDTILSGLGNRVFLINNVHQNGPELFQTRNALSHLTGPLTLPQIKQLRTKPDAVQASTNSTNNAQSVGSFERSASSSVSAPSPLKDQSAGNLPVTSHSSAALTPVLPPDIKTCYLPIRTDQPPGASLVYSPRLFAVGNVKFVDTKYGVDTTLQYCLLATVSGDVTGVAWDKASPAKVWLEELVSVPEQNASYDSLPVAMSDSKNYTEWSKQFSTWLFASKTVHVWKSEATGEFSKPRESERDFRVRLSQLAREKRDQAKAALSEKYQAKLDKAKDVETRKSQALQKEQAEFQQQQLNAAVNVGATMLGAFMNRRGGNVGRASSAARSMARSAKEQQDVKIAADNLQQAQVQYSELESAFRSEVAALESKFDAASMPLTQAQIAPKKANIIIPLLALAWAPYWKLETGERKPAWIRTES